MYEPGTAPIGLPRGWMGNRKSGILFKYTAGDNISALGGLGGTFTRADASTCATLVNEQGVVETVAANYLRDRHYINGAGPYTLLEGSRQNVCLHSGDLTNATWTFSNPGSRTNNVTAPDGTANGACTVTDNQAGSFTDVDQSVTVANDSTTWTFVFYVKKTSGAASFPGAELAFTGAGNLFYGVTINTDTGVLTARTGETPSATTSTTVGGWWRVSLSGANNSSGKTTMKAFLYPAVNTDGSGTWAAGTTGSAVFWGAQLENAAFPSSYIPTGASAVTRSADAFSFPFPYAPGPMTVYVKGVDLGIAASGNVYWSMGAKTGIVQPYLFCDANAATTTRFLHQEATNVSDVETTSYSYGDTFELASVLAETGTAQLIWAKNGGNATNGTTSGTKALSAAWHDQFLELNSLNLSSQGFAAFQKLVIAAGVRSLAEMRLL